MHMNIELGLRTFALLTVVALATLALVASPDPALNAMLAIARN